MLDAPDSRTKRNALVVGVAQGPLNIHRVCNAMIKIDH